ncbi:MAG: hypothetical protein DHS20C17_11920 [Cyclobacteriaceae bacterium]|nr:MAG: hypothetical protein DHS20C17_11920 [Cyclobacteriaceae bacterium]
MNYQILHNSSVGVAFLGTILIVLEVLQEMEALQLATLDYLDIPGIILLIIGSVMASWTARKMDKKDKES